MKKIMFLLVGTVFVLMSSCRKDSETDVHEINFNPSIAYGSMTDQDGNIYRTVAIGTQVWMAENLRTTKYRNGIPIREVSDAKQWQKLLLGAYCKYNNDQAYVKVFGYLYNWFAVNNGNNIAPVGWHVPSSDEYNTLVNYLGGWEGVAKLLMESGESHWNCPGNINAGATNESGFTALPGGERFFGYNFLLDKMDPPEYMNLSCVGCWWTITTKSTMGPGFSCTDCANCFVISYTNANAFLTDGYIYHAHSVRCIKD